MKTFVLLFVTFSLAYADPSTTSTGSGSTETSSKSETKTQLPSNTGPNSISPAKNPYYSTRTSNSPNYVQLVQKPTFTPHHTGVGPHTTFIIAQPALLPHNFVYSQPQSHQAQQLLNYFHSNPSAKYQLLYNYQPQVQQHQTHQAYQGQGHTQSHGQGQAIVYAAPQHPAYQNFQYLNPQSQYYYVQPQQSHSSSGYQGQQYQIPQTYTHLPQYQFSAGRSTESQSQIPKAEALKAPRPSYSQGKSQGHQTPFVPSTPISPSLHHSLQQVSSQISTQHQSQPTQSQPQYTTHYHSQGPQTFTAQPPTGPIKSVAPIITGLENFTPEQQAQIKEQLSSHFGGLTQINSNSLQASPEYQTKFKIEVQAPEADYTSVSTQPSQATENNLKQEGREEQHSEDPSIQYQQHLHQPHYLSQRQEPPSYSGPVYSYKTPQYTKG